MPSTYQDDPIQPLFPPAASDLGAVAVGSLMIGSGAMLYVHSHHSIWMAADQAVGGAILLGAGLTRLWRRAKPSEAG